MLGAWDWIRMADRHDGEAYRQLLAGNVYEAGVQYQLGLDALTRGLPTLRNEGDPMRRRYQECIAFIRDRWLVTHRALIVMAECFVAAPTFAHLGVEGKRLLLGDWLPAWQR